jgi:hypothetical protein
MSSAGIYFDMPHRRWYLVALMAIWAVLLYAGNKYYVGSAATYWVFSVVSLFTLISGLIARRIYTYLFLVIFLYLGFWFKLTANFLIFGHFPFGEPIGRFDGSPGAWDEVLWIAIAAQIGAMLGRLVWLRYHVSLDVQDSAPEWYESARKLLWAGLGLFTVAVALLNVMYGVQQIGLAPRTIFPWPLNAVIAWSLNIGCALAIAVLTVWDMASGRKLGWQPYAMVAGAFVSTVTIMSRSLFLFHTMAILVSLILGKLIRHYTRFQIVLFAGFILGLFAASIAAVSFSRDYQYATTQARPVEQPVTIIPESQNKQAHLLDEARDGESEKPAISSFRWILLHQLIINRWIGLEGVMSASAHEGRSIQLLQELAFEKREIGKATAYQKISNSGYQVDDPKFQFATMPGVAGFMYLSGSLGVVVIGVAFLVSLAIAGEWLLAQLTRNPLFCSLYGITAANALAQLGVTPRQDLPQFMMIFLMGLFIYILQPRFR